MPNFESLTCWRQFEFAITHSSHSKTPAKVYSGLVFNGLRAYLTGGDVAATDQLRQLGRLGRPKNDLRSHQGDVTATAETDQSQRLGRPTHGLRSHVAETSPRPAGDWKSLPKKIEHVWASRDSPETRLVSASSSRHLVSRPVR